MVEQQPVDVVYKVGLIGATTTSRQANIQVVQPNLSLLHEWKISVKS